MRISAKSINTAFITSFSSAAFSASAPYLSAGTLLQIYTTDAEVVQIGIIRMAILCAPYFLCGIMDVMVGSLRGLGHSLIPMIVSLIGVCGMRLIWVYTLFRMNMNLGLLYASYPISWILTFAVLFVSFQVLYRKEIKPLLNVQPA